MSLPNPPTLDDWIRRMRLVQHYQRQWRAEAKLGEDLYELRWKMDGIPDGVPITMPSTARAVVDEATDHSDFDPRWLRIHTPTYGLGLDAEQSASRLRAFFPGWGSYQISHMNDVSPFRDFVKNVYLYGKGVYKVVYDKMEWPLLEIEDGETEADVHRKTKEIERDRQFVVPVLLRSLNPTAVFEDPSLGQKRWVIEEYEHDAVEVLPLYENFAPTNMSREEFEELAADDPNHRVRIWDCYQIGEKDSKKGIWHQVFIDSGVEGAPIVAPADGVDAEPAFLEGEPFPYVIKYSGLGRQTGKYEEKARSILYGAKSLLMAEGRRMTQLDAIVAAYAWPTLFVTGPRTRFRVVYGPNVVNYIPPGVEVDTVSPTIPSGPIQSSLATIQSGIERATFGSVIRGDKPPQTTSAAQLAILSGQARLRFGAAKIHQEAALWDVFQKVSILIKDVIKHPITIWQTNDTNAQSPDELTLKPADIPSKFSAHIEIITDPVEERERRAQLALFLWKEGVVDWEWAAEAAGVEDTAEMRRRMIRDKVLLETPAVIQSLGEQFLLESGYDLESLTLEKMMRDMLILRSQQDMQQAIFSTPGGSTAPGNQPNPGSLSPAQLGGAPPTPQLAQDRGEASAAGVV